MTRIDTGTDELLCEINRRVAVVTLDKPHKKNALGESAWRSRRTIRSRLKLDT